MWKINSNWKISVALANGRNEGLNEISSFIPQLTLRIRNLPLEDHATMIANHIEQNDDLMQNDPQSEHLRSEILRDMPQCLTVKRTVKAKLSFSASQKLKKKPVGYLKRLKYRISMSFTKVFILIFRSFLQKNWIVISLPSSTTNFLLKLKFSQAF